MDTVVGDGRQVVEDTWYGMLEMVLSTDKWVLAEHMIAVSEKLEQKLHEHLFLLLSFFLLWKFHFLRSHLFHWRMLK